VIVEKDALTEALAPVDKVARNGRDIPILSHVLLAATDGALVVRGSNLDEEITATVARGFSGEAVDAFTCPSQQLMEFSRNAPGSEIDIELEQRAGHPVSAVFRSGRARLRLPVLSATDFPRIGLDAFTHRLTCSGRILATAIKAVAFAVSDDPSRTYLHGVYLHPCGEGLTVVATDGHRLVRRIIASAAFDDDDDLANIPSVILPTKTVARLLPIIDCEEDITVELSDAAARFSAGGTSIVTKLVDGIFPDYSRVIPAPGPHRAVIGVGELAAAVKRVMFVDPDKSKRVRFTFSPSALELWARADDGAESQDVIGIECDTEITIGFNGRYILDMLAHCDGAKLEMVTFSPGDPALFRIPGEERNLAVLMPLRV
jgi:DNA polymerase-3 subunit beta